MCIFKIELLIKEVFVLFGDVIEIVGSDYFMINNGFICCYYKLVMVEIVQLEDNVIISIFSVEKLEMLLCICMLECYLLGSQVFILLFGNFFLVVVVLFGDVFVLGFVCVFLINGRQGVNYYCGVWYYLVLMIEKWDDFLVVDCSGFGNNCDEYFFIEDEQFFFDF